jgi:arsenate reductase (glutaredoxin)
MAWKVYLYQKCSTCRDAVKWLEKKRIDFAVKAIRETPPSLPELKRMLGIYGGEIRRLFNSSGLDYKAMDLKTKLPKLSEVEALKLLSENGNLVKRPFVLTTRGGAVGFKADEWEKLR